LDALAVKTLETLKMKVIADLNAALKTPSGVSVKLKIKSKCIIMLDSYSLTRYDARTIHNILFLIIKD